ncbi:hypothetical protein V1511DRAFT_502011 [Dipodascopsis uninucleata]
MNSVLMVYSPPSSSFYHSGMADANMNVLWSLLVELSNSLNSNREASAHLFQLAETISANAGTSQSPASSPLLFSSSSSSSSNSSSSSPDNANEQGSIERPLHDHQQQQPKKLQKKEEGNGATNKVESPQNAEEKESSCEGAETFQTYSFAELEQLRQENKILRNENEDLDLLVQQFEHTLSRIMGGIRDFVEDHNSAVLDLRKGYHTQLDQEKKKYELLYSVYLEQQQKIKDLSTLFQKSHELASAELEDDIVTVVEALERENEGLRKALGVD